MVAKKVHSSIDTDVGTGPLGHVCLFGQLPVLVAPLLRQVVFLLLGVRNLSSGFHLALKHKGPEAILEQIALGLEKTERVAELVWQDDFERGLR